MEKIQIGIMGLAADLNYSKETLDFAKELGQKIAQSGNILVYGAEKAIYIIINRSCKRSK